MQNKWLSWDVMKAGQVLSLLGVCQLSGLALKTSDKLRVTTLDFAAWHKSSVFPEAMWHGTLYFLESRNLALWMWVCILELRVVSQGTFVILLAYLDQTMCSLEGPVWLLFRCLDSFGLFTRCYFSRNNLHFPAETFSNVNSQWKQKHWNVYWGIIAPLSGWG